MHRPSFCFVTSGSCLTRLKPLDAWGKKVILFNPDNPLPPHSNNRAESLRLISEVDLYLIWSVSLAAKIKKLGAKRSEFFPLAWDRDLHPPVYQNTGVQRGVLFIGGWEKSRELFLNKVAKRLPLKIYGPDYWRTRTNFNSHARDAWENTDVRGAEFSKAVCNFSININPLREQHIIDGVPDAVIMRTFEVPGCGGFLLSTRAQSALTLFTEDVEAVYFDCLDEFIDKAKYYMANDSARDKIRLRAHKKTARYFTYVENVKKLVSLIDSI